MGVELGEVFPGGFGPSQGVGVPPHQYARTDLFSYDPDYSLETVDSVNEPHEVVQRLLEQYVVPATEIQMNLATVESGGLERILSMKFRERIHSDHSERTGGTLRTGRRVAEVTRTANSTFCRNELYPVSNFPRGERPAFANSRKRQPGSDRQTGTVHG